MFPHNYGNYLNNKSASIFFIYLYPLYLELDVSVLDSTVESGVPVNVVHGCDVMGDQREYFLSRFFCVVMQLEKSDVLLLIFFVRSSKKNANAGNEEEWRHCSNLFGYMPPNKRIRLNEQRTGVFIVFLRSGSSACSSMTRFVRFSCIFVPRSFLIAIPRLDFRFRIL